jgi:hypothetical protein
MDCYRSRLLSISILLLVLFSSCSEKAEVSKGFYFWRTSFIEPEEQKFLREQNIQKVYARLMDIDWNEVQGAIPVSHTDVEELHYHLTHYDSLKLYTVPVIFITNKTFERINPKEIPLLAKRIVRRCLPAYDSTDVAYETRNYYTHYVQWLKPLEIQFDCDWTVKTAPAFFKFLREVNALLPGGIDISATIRLHQYKYFSKTGVPPVDRGMLMMYNISDPKKYSKVNSIFDVKQAKAYFNTNKKYPLPLDIALPSWSWCIIYRNKEFYQVENGLSEEDLRQLAFLKPTGDHFYTVTKDTVYRELFLRPGDEIKAEGIDAQLMTEAAKLARSAVNSDRYTVSFFDLTYKDIKQFPNETFSKLYASFR